MSTLSEILDFNTQFVQDRGYEAFLTDRFPNKKLVVVTCMDTRLIELLPRAMNIRNGDVMMIKVAGAVVSHPYGSVMRSILVALYKLEAQEVAVVGHHGCGMLGLNSQSLIQTMSNLGVPPDAVETVNRANIDMETWLSGFTSIQESVLASVKIIRNHPLLPKNLPVHGLVMDPETGKLDLVVDGYTQLPATVSRDS